QGSLESNTSKGAPVVQFFNELGVSAATIGNHEFDFGLDALRSRMSEAKYPYVIANVREGDAEVPFPNAVPSLILKAGTLKVGIIGLVTETTPVTTRKVLLESLRFA